MYPYENPNQVNGAMALEAPPAQLVNKSQEAGVAREMQHLRGNMEGLEKLLQSLREKLNPVLRPATPSPAGSQSATPVASLSPVADSVLGLCGHVSHLFDICDDIHQRLDV